jgi:hypothetical protein
VIRVKDLFERELKAAGNGKEMVTVGEKTIGRALCETVTATNEGPNKLSYGRVVFWSPKEPNCISNGAPRMCRFGIWFGLQSL